MLASEGSFASNAAFHRAALAPVTDEFASSIEAGCVTATASRSLQSRKSSTRSIQGPRKNRVVHQPGTKVTDSAVVDQARSCGASARDADSCQLSADCRAEVGQQGDNGLRQSACRYRVQAHVALIADEILHEIIPTYGLALMTPSAVPAAPRK